MTKRIIYLFLISFFFVILSSTANALPGCADVYTDTSPAWQDPRLFTTSTPKDALCASAAPCECVSPQNKISCELENKQDGAEVRAHWYCKSDTPCDSEGFDTNAFDCTTKYENNPPCLCQAGAKPKCQENAPMSVLKYTWSCDTKSDPTDKVDPAKVPIWETGIPGIIGKGETMEPQTLGLTGLLNKIIKLVYAFVGILVFVMIVWGGIIYLTSRGNSSSIKDAQDRIVQALLGLFFLFASYLILNTINPELVRISDPTFPKIDWQKLDYGGGGTGKGTSGPVTGDTGGTAPNTMPNGFAWPVDRIPSQDAISSCYGYRGYIADCVADGLGRWCYCHQGIDIAVSDGSAVYAIADGTVIMSGKSPGCGPYAIDIQHVSPEGKTYFSGYCHLNSNLKVAGGDEIKKGALIGYTDGLGHLHITFGSEAGFAPDENRIDPACFFGKDITYDVPGVCMASTPVTQQTDGSIVCNFPAAGNCQGISVGNSLPEPLSIKKQEALESCIFNGSSSDLTLPSLSTPQQYCYQYVCDSWAKAAYACAGIKFPTPDPGVGQIYEAIKKNKVTTPQKGDLAIWCNADNWHPDTKICDVPGANEPSNHIGIYIGNNQIAACNGYKQSRSGIWVETLGTCKDNGGDKTCPEKISEAYAATGTISQDFDNGEGLKTFPPRIFIGYFRPNF